MFIDTHNFRALSEDSLSDGVEAFKAVGHPAQHLIVSRSDQSLGEVLGKDHDLRVSYVAVLPLGSWMLCSEDAIFIGGEREGQHTIVMWMA